MPLLLPSVVGVASFPIGDDPVTMAALKSAARPSDGLRPLLTATTPTG